MSLRADNADLRLTPKGRDAGCVGDKRWDFLQQKMADINAAKQVLSDFKLSVYQWEKRGIKICQDGTVRSAMQILEYSRVKMEDIEKIINDARQEAPVSSTEIFRVSDLAREHLTIEAKYRSHLVKQDLEIDRFKKTEDLPIPENIDYSKLGMLSAEEVQKLSHFKPRTIHAAGKIQGITPSSLLLIAKTAREHRGNISS